MQVKEIGEEGLLERLHRFCDPQVVGDDGAVLEGKAGYQWVITTDVLVEGVHFSERTTPPHAVGWRSVAANLSDLAAMGSSPVGITVGLGLPGETEVGWVEALYQGMRDCLEPYQTEIVGGDVVRSPIVTVSITAVGRALPQHLIRRHTGKPGDLILVTGVHGASRAGLECLLQPQWGKSLEISDRQTLIHAHQYPQPRLDVLPLLQNLHSPRLTGMDSSDGLGDALEQLCRASQVGAQIYLRQISYPPILSSTLSPEQLYEWVFYGGEDFELVLCLPPAYAHPLLNQLSSKAAIIGVLTDGSEIEIIAPTGENPKHTLNRRWGFQHFSSGS